MTADALLVRDLMTVGVATCAPATPIIDVVRLLLAKDLEGLVVLNDEGHAIGVISQDELVAAYARADRDTLTAEAIMREGVPQVPPDIPAAAAAQIMRDLRVRVVFMIHHADGKTYPAAVLSYRHLLRHLAAQHTSELTDLGIKAERRPPLESFIQKRDAARRRAQFPEEE